MDIQEFNFKSKYRGHFTPNQTGELMTQDQWNRARATGCADWIKESAAEIATLTRSSSIEDVQGIVETQIKKCK